MNKTALFELGQIVATAGVNELIESKRINPTELLDRHSTGDWGELSEDDKQLNSEALETGEDRIFSSYNTSAGRVWIITEYHRELTTLLLPSEY